MGHFYLKYIDVDGTVYWYYSNVAGWKDTQETLQGGRPRKFHSNEDARRRLSMVSKTSKGMARGVFSIFQGNVQELVEDIKAGANNVCINRECERIDCEGDFDDAPERTMVTIEHPTYVVGYGYENEREVYMVRHKVGDQNKRWMSIRELRENGLKMKKFISKEAAERAIESTKRLGVATGGQYRALPSDDFAGLSWEDVARGLAGQLNVIADYKISPNAAKSAWIKSFEGIKGQAGAMLDICQMRNEDEED